MSAFPAVIELNVGGVSYATSLDTLRSEDGSWLQEVFSGSAEEMAKDSQGRFFIDRDGTLFRYVLDYLRDPTKFKMPTDFPERERLQREAQFFRLSGMVEAVTKETGTITIGYRGSFQFGRDGLADVKFRKITRLLVHGRVALCREVFGDTLNESRDPDHGGPDRYTARFFLKHVFIEQAFDLLQDSGFRCVGSCGSGTAGSVTENLKPGVDAEENRWNHYNEFVFVRD